MRMEKDILNDAEQSVTNKRGSQNDVTSPLSQPKTVDGEADKTKASPSKPTGKKRKHKAQKDVTAPRQPLTGYVRYLNERRDALRAANPKLGFAEVTRRLASDWGRLTTQEKQQYLDAAELDRERYIVEWAAYKETEAYRVFRQQQLEQRKDTNTPGSKKARGSTPQNALNKSSDINTTLNPSDSLPSPTAANGGSATENIPSSQAQHRLHPLSSNSLLTHKTSLTPVSNAISVQESGRGATDPNQKETDIPIFTEKFLQHNKLRETELRQLRKANTDYEQQNAILQKHMENMRGAVERARVESAGHRCRTSLMRIHLTALVDKLVRGLGHLPIPGGPTGATKQNVEHYMESLRVLASENKSHSTVKQARDFLNRMDMPA